MLTMLWYTMLFALSCKVQSFCDLGPQCLHKMRIALFKFTIFTKPANKTHKLYRRKNDVKCYNSVDI